MRNFIKSPPQLFTQLYLKLYLYLKKIYGTLVADRAFFKYILFEMKYRQFDDFAKLVNKLFLKKWESYLNNCF